MSRTGCCSRPGAPSAESWRSRRSLASVAAFLAAEADRGFRPVTIGRRAAAIAAAHRAQDHPNPCDSGAVAAVMSGIRREHGTRPLRKAAPLELDPLARLLEPIDTATLAGQRDRALLLLGFAAALRRSELVALDVVGEVL
jgi:site-specific recombinase XerC